MNILNPGGAPGAAPVTPKVTSPVATEAVVIPPAAATGRLPGKLVTYEDCMAAITAAKANPSPSDKDAALTSLESFFKERIGRKSAKEDTDAMSSVKRALNAGRTARYGSRPPATSPSTIAG